MCINYSFLVQRSVYLGKLCLAFNFYGLKLDGTCRRAELFVDSLKDMML
jgi:hypothetical protein